MYTILFYLILGSFSCEGAAFIIKKVLWIWLFCVLSTYYLQLSGAGVQEVLQITVLWSSYITLNIVSAVLSQYLKYVSSLGFQTKPDYTFCRDLLRQGIEDSGYVDDGKLVFGARLCPRIIKNKKVNYSLNIFLPNNIHYILFDGVHPFP